MIDSERVLRATIFMRKDGVKVIIINLKNSETIPIQYKPAWVGWLKLSNIPVEDLTAFNDELQDFYLPTYVLKLVSVHQIRQLRQIALSNKDKSSSEKTD